MNRGYKETGNPAKIRQLNRRAVLSYLRAEQKTSRAMLAKTLNLAPATVSVVVGDLIEDGWLIETGLLHIDKRSPGRPSKEIKLNSDVAYVVGVVMRLEHDVLFLDTSWSDYSGKVSIGPTVIVEDKENVSLIVESVLTELKKLFEGPLVDHKVISVCVGIPGVVNSSEVLFCPNMQNLQGSELHHGLKEGISLPIYYENDVNLIVVSELNAQPRLNTLNFSCLFISQGVGVGTALNGELWKSSGWAGEIGQLDVPFRDEGVRKLEWIVGMDGYIAECEKACGIGLDEMFSKLRHGEFDAGSVEEHMVHLYVDYLYMAIQLLNAAFDLDEVILGESSEHVVAACLPLLQRKIKESHLKLALSSGLNAHQSSVEGAALLALQHALDSLEQ